MKLRHSVAELRLKPWLLIVVLTMTGCASGLPFRSTDDIPADKALVYIYRTVPPLLHGVGAEPPVTINGLNAIPMEPGGYYPYYSAPGEVTVSIRHNIIFRRSITIDVNAGEIYYVKAGINFVLGSPYIELVPAEQGLTEIANCNRLPDVPGV